MWTVWLLEGRLGENWVQRKADCCPSRNAEVKNVCSLHVASHHSNKLCLLLTFFSREWLLEFLERDGLGVLLESLNRLGDQKVHSVADTFTQMECMSCLRTVINFRPGLQYIVQRNEYIRKLAAGSVAGAVYTVVTATFVHSEVCPSDMSIVSFQSQVSTECDLVLPLSISSRFLKVTQ